MLASCIHRPKDRPAICFDLYHRASPRTHSCSTLRETLYLSGGRSFRSRPTRQMLLLVTLYENIATAPLAKYFTPDRLSRIGKARWSVAIRIFLHFLDVKENFCALTLARIFAYSLVSRCIELCPCDELRQSPFIELRSARGCCYAQVRLHEKRR